MTTIFGWEEEEIDSGLVFIVTIFKFYIIIVFFNLNELFPLDCHPSRVRVQVQYIAIVHLT